MFIHVPKAAGTTIMKLFEPCVYRNGHRSFNDARDGFQGSRSKFDSLFRFSFVRNPWGRYVSHFFWRVKGGHVTDTSPKRFRAFVRSQFENQRHTNPDVMFEGAHFNLVGRYETLQADVARCGRALGVAVPSVLQHHHKGLHPDIDWRPYYDDETREIVAEMGAWEIDRFGYTFEDPA